MDKKNFLFEVGNVRVYKDKDGNYFLLDKSTSQSVQIPKEEVKVVLKGLLD